MRLFMNPYNARETAYKNGYEQGRLDAEKEYKSRLKSLLKFIKN